jgi:peroxiredoxin
MPQSERDGRQLAGDGDGDEDDGTGTSPSWAVLHLFCPVAASLDASGVAVALKRCEASGHQIVTAALLGHKADLAILAVGPSGRQLRTLQTDLRLAGCEPSWSFVSRTEVSEYAAGVPDAMREARMHPRLPPQEMPAFCFYTMSKRRTASDNWYRLPYDERLKLMHEHGASGRRFRGRVLQLVTGSTGLDDWEWGVTLFARTYDDLKECVYTMRFDEVSARYADFGPFVAGEVLSPDDVLALLAAGQR